MITLPLWSLICLCLPYLAMGVWLFYIFILYRQAFKEGFFEEDERADLEENPDPLVRRFQEDKSVRALMFLDENELDVFAKILIFAKEELMGKMNKDCVEGYLEPAQRYDILLMIDRCNLFLKRVRHPEEGNDGI